MNKEELKQELSEQAELENAIKIVRQNGYIVTKWTKRMEEAANECEEMQEHGKNKDCCGCPCSICLIQGGF